MSVIKAGKLFEDALKDSGIHLIPGQEFLVKTIKKKGHLVLLINNDDKPSKFELDILNRAKSAAVYRKEPYKTNLTVGEKIKIYRKELKISLTELARKAKISKGSLGSIERNERPIGLIVLKRIANALKIDISLLV